MAYIDVIDVDSPLIHLRLGETSGTVAANRTGGSNGTYAPSSGGSWTGGTLGQTGISGGNGDTAALFNGTSGYVSVPLNLSAYSVITVSFWLKWTTYANNDKLAGEFTANINSNAGGFLIDPNSGFAAGSFEVAIGITGSFNRSVFNRPSAGAWHHYAFVFTRGVTTGGCKSYVDGARATGETFPTTANTSGNFANSTLYLMSRGGSSLFGAGTMDEFAIFSGELSSTRIAAHYNAGLQSFQPAVAFHTLRSLQNGL